MISLPIYYTKHYKTKPDKTFYVGLNWFRNAYHHEINEVKKYYHSLVATYNNITAINGPYKLKMLVYYKNPSSDGHNATIVEKFFLDAIQELNIVKQDNVKYHLGTIWEVAGQDKDNPRMEIEIIPHDS
ncbi:MAG: hypothetical protein PVF17_01455 [Ignavibacteria bacterium]|jgi:hypothetical protein